MINIKSNLNGISPYKVVEQDIWHNPDKVKYKLDWNEEFIINDKIQNKILEFINSKNYTLYPDAQSKKLNFALSKFHDVEVNNILTFSGSDDALDTICRTYLEVGDKVLLRNPEYGNFLTFVEINGGEIVKTKDEDPFTLDIDNFYNNILNVKPKIVYLSNPNNPTGILYKYEDLLKMIEDFRDVLFIIDEAYIHFAYEDKSQQDKLMKHIGKFDNIIIVRTFSKLFSLAGLRIGYIVANKNIISSFDITRKGKNVSMIGQVAALEAIEHFDYFMNKSIEIRKIKSSTIEKISKLDYVKEVYDSSGNFICVEVKNNTLNSLLNYLKKNGVYVRNRDNLDQLSNIFRVTIIENMNYFIDLMESFVVS